MKEPFETCLMLNRGMCIMICMFFLFKLLVVFNKSFIFRREEDDYNERMNEVYAAAGRILHEDDQEGGAPVDDEEDLVHVEDAAMDDIFYDGNEEALRMSLATYQQEQQRMRENYMEATQMQREDEQDQAINAAILQNEHAALMDQGAAEKAARLEQENEQQLTERADAEKVSFYRNLIFWFKLLS